VTQPPPEFVREFAQSMGAIYRGKHHEGEIAEHAGVAFRRGRALVRVELVTRRQPETSMLCVVADDRPGLLALISAAFVLCDLDIADAAAYTRRTSSGRLEAVDLFEVRDVDPTAVVRAARNDRSGLSPSKVEEIELTLILLLEGKRSTAEAKQYAGASVPRETETTVRFLENADGQLATLEVETDDRSGLLLSLAEALYTQKVQIIGSEVRTLGTRVSDRFHIVEIDERPIGPDRRLQIQLAVMSALGR
jgi:UTP:GlnB (protein PII) uridylyltransferase